MAWIRAGPFGMCSDGEAMIRKRVTSKIGEVVVANGDSVISLYTELSAETDRANLGFSPIDLSTGEVLDEFVS
jgi:hypothetical protein